MGINLTENKDMLLQRYPGPGNVTATRIALATVYFIGFKLLLSVEFVISQQRALSLSNSFQINENTFSISHLKTPI